MEKDKISIEDCTLEKAQEFALANYKNILLKHHGKEYADAIMEAIKVAAECGYKIAKKHTSLVTKELKDNLDKKALDYFNAMADVSIQTESDFKTGAFYVLNAINTPK